MRTVTIPLTRPERTQRSSRHDHIRSLSTTDTKRRHVLCRQPPSRSAVIGRVMDRLHDGSLKPSIRGCDEVLHWSPSGASRRHHDFLGLLCRCWRPMCHWVLHRDKVERMGCLSGFGSNDPRIHLPLTAGINATGFVLQ